MSSPAAGRLVEPARAGWSRSA